MSMSLGVSHGVVDFAGYEFSFAPAPVELHWVAALLWGCSRMALEHGTIYKDGDTMSDEGQERASMPPPPCAQGNERVFGRYDPDRSSRQSDGSRGDRRADHVPPAATWGGQHGPDDPGFFKRLLRGGRRDS
ncbi:MAG: hypothetical protein JKP98_22235 [Rhodobacteraceae bacterium]|nr:hypothetical protein [Paracoccaceae bacterium]